LKLSLCSRYSTVICWPSILRSTTPNDGLQLRRAISIGAERKSLREKHAIAPSAARLCYARGGFDSSTPGAFFRILNAKTKGTTLKAIMTSTGNDNSPTENPCAGLRFTQTIARKKKILGIERMISETMYVFTSGRPNSSIRPRRRIQTADSHWKIPGMISSAPRTPDSRKKMPRRGSK
jgi:hypothetical protein